MNARQKRYARRYWKYIVEVDEPWYATDRADWLIENFGRRTQGRRYTWGSCNPTWYQFHHKRDYLAFVLRWGA